MNQFEINNKVNPIFQFFKLLAFVKHSVSDNELLNSWKKFIALNGFTKLRTYLGSVHFLIKVSQHNAENKELKVFSWINASEIPHHLLNLSFNISEFVQDETKRIDYKGMKEKPLFNTTENEFVILDIDYLNNKIYNGPLFDMFNQTQMSEVTRFKQFPDFKTYISTNVSENILFKGIFKKLFLKKNRVLYFNDENLDNCPDCYIREGNRIYLIEFKDYLLPGKIIESYSFEKIKEHLDLKFIKNEKGSNKGITQIIEQIKILTTKQFEFDKFLNKKTKVYPIIVHTNFLYQMPGVNSYLHKEFKNNLAQQIPNLDIEVQDLTIIDLETFFELLQLHDFGLRKLDVFLKRYKHILENRTIAFEKNPHPDYFVRARASFDEIYKTIFQPEEKHLTGYSIMTTLLRIIDANDELLDSF